MGIDIIIQLSLCTLHAFETAETLQMSATDIGNDAVVRFANRHELCNVIRMACPHFNDSKLCLGSHLEHR